MLPAINNQQGNSNNNMGSIGRNDLKLESIKIQKNKLQNSVEQLKLESAYSSDLASQGQASITDKPAEFPSLFAELRYVRTKLSRDFENTTYESSKKTSEFIEPSLYEPRQGNQDLRGIFSLKSAYDEYEELLNELEEDIKTKFDNFE